MAGFARISSPILGPWRWMLIIYSYEELDDVVLIVAFQDARSSAAATAP
jgi:hypothetical protein